jgi:hypothetical protein
MLKRRTKKRRIHGKEKSVGFTANITLTKLAKELGWRLLIEPMSKERKLKPHEEEEE